MNQLSARQRVVRETAKTAQLKSSIAQTEVRRQVGVLINVVEGRQAQLLERVTKEEQGKLKRLGKQADGLAKMVERLVIIDRQMEEAMKQGVIGAPSAPPGGGAGNCSSAPTADW